jgi:hypothetical protein
MQVSIRRGLNSKTTTEDGSNGKGMLQASNNATLQVAIAHILQTNTNQKSSVLACHEFFLNNFQLSDASSKRDLG